MNAEIEQTDKGTTEMDKPKVLVVDDIALNIQVLNETLQPDYQVYFATNAKDALRIAETVRPDLILLDIMMPETNGYDLLKEIKNNPQLRDIPVIFITAMSETQYETKGLEIGAVDYITKPFNPDIVRLRVKNQIQLKQHRDLLMNLSHIDGLTGVANRRAFDEALEREWLRAKRSKMPISILMIDIDFFKDYNDTFGHSAGDECLKTIASTIKSALFRPSDLVARYGGEEFVCLLPETDIKGASQTADKIKGAIEKLKIPHPSSKVASHVTVSIGVASRMPIDGKGSKVLLDEADKALYSAKRAGRNRIVLFGSEELKSETLPLTDNQPKLPTGKELRDLLVLFFEENPNPVLCIRPDGLILYGNRSASKIFNEWCCSPGSFIPHTFYHYIEDLLNGKAVELTFGDRVYAFNSVQTDKRDVLFLYGSDITEKKSAEAELKRLKSVIDESINIVFITDNRGNIEYVNSTFVTITGYSKEEVVGKNPRILASGETSQASYKNLWETIKSGKTWRGLFKNKKKNGELYWANGFISPIKNEKGQITHFMAIQEDITEKILAESRLHYLATYDSTTSILNRNRFVELLTDSINSKDNPVRQGVLLQVNIDAFKLINDTYGYSIGDQFLKNFADFLKEHTNELDLKSMKQRASLIGRLGGDEFAIFLFDTDEREGSNIAEDLRKKIENYRFLNDMIRVTASIGIVIYPEQGATTAELLSKANAATNRAKELGQNRCYLYKDEDSYLRTASSSLEEKQLIITAMEEDRFIPYFQPILDIKANSIHHYESLARLITYDGKVLLPSSFIFTAERYGLVSSIDRIITHKTMVIQGELSRLGRKITFSMNLSGKHLGDEEMLEYIKTSLRETGADPECIVFELTETAAIRDLSSAVAFVKELKDTGCKFSLDDFGVGFTSFVHLIDMSVDFIKIDGSFIRHLPERQRDRILVATIAEMAKGLGIKTIAEYVDKEETLKILKDLGVDYAQGYYIGRPSPTLLD